MLETRSQGVQGVLYIGGSLRTSFCCCLRTRTQEIDVHSGNNFSHDIGEIRAVQMEAVQTDCPRSSIDDDVEQSRTSRADRLLLLRTHHVQLHLQLNVPLLT